MTTYTEAIPAAITPTGTSVIEGDTGNGNMETGDPPTGWIGWSGPTLSSVLDERTGGAGTHSLNVILGGSPAPVYRVPTITTGLWYSLSGWVKNEAINSSGLYFYDLGSGQLIVSTSSTSWTFVIETMRCLSGATAEIGMYRGGDSAVYVRFDDVILKPLTLASTFGSPYTLPVQDFLVQNEPTITAKTQMGVAIVDDTTAPANGVFVYHNGVNLLMDSLVAGVWANKISAAAAYAAGRAVKLVRVGTDYSAYYDGTQIGTTQSIMTAAITAARKLVRFNTYAGNTDVDYYIEYISLAGHGPGSGLLHGTIIRSTGPG